MKTTAAVFVDPDLAAGARHGSRQLRGPWRIAILGLASAAMLLLLAGVEIYFGLGNYSYLSFAFAGSFLTHIRMVPDRRSWVTAAGVGILYGALYAALGKPVYWLDCAGFAGVGSVAVLGLTALWSGDGFRSPEVSSALKLAVAFPVFLMYSGFALALTLSSHPKTLDLYLYQFESRLGFQPSFVAGTWFHSWGLLRTLAYIGYETLPLSMAYAIVTERRLNRRPKADLFTAFVGAAVAGLVIYNVFPATGPRHIFGDRFPFSPPAAPIPAPIFNASAPRNAMPSIHLAMALLIFWHSRPWSWPPRIFAGALLIVTVLATLGFGEHYLIDLVVAVPLALSIEAIATRDSPANHQSRMISIAAGSVLVAAWLCYLRLAPPALYPSTAVAWCAIAVTVLSALLLERAMAHHRG
jgi:hypothetical protein